MLGLRVLVKAREDSRPMRKKDIRYRAKGAWKIWFCNWFSKPVVMEKIVRDRT